MSLVPDYDDSSDSSTSNSSESGNENTIETSKAVLPTPAFKLPTPSFEKGNSDEPKTSVFSNPFIEAENAKEAILQKHVKMVDMKDAIVINGKKICWNYRKGRCRFGHNCKYAHDSDIQKTPEELEAEKVQARQNSVVCSSGVTGFSQKSLPQPTEQDIEKIQEEMSKDKKKRRPGLTQGLVPGKKVMKKYLSHKI